MQILGWKSYASDVYPLLCADILTKPCDLVRFLPSHCQHRSVRVYFRTGFLPFLSSCISFFCHSYLICFPSLLIVSLHLLFFYFAPPPLFLRYFRTLREKHQLALSCRSVRLSVGIYERGFQETDFHEILLCIFTKTCRQTRNLFKMGHKYRL